MNFSVHLNNLFLKQFLPAVKPIIKIEVLKKSLFFYFENLYEPCC